MENYIYAFLAGGVIMIASLVGVIFTRKSINGWLVKNLKFLVSFSAGVFLFSSFNLITESLELSSHMGNKNIAIISTAVGFLIFLITQKIIPESHHHHEEECEDGHKESGWKRMLLGDAIHNIGDGIIIASTFLIDIKIGIITSLGILVHETLQEISEFFVLKKFGLSTKSALIKNFLVSGTILIGIVLGVFVKGNEILDTIILGVAGGGFIFLVFHDLLPYKDFKNKKFWKHILFFILGFSLVFIINKNTPHSHEHGDVSHSHEEENLISADGDNHDHTHESHDHDHENVLQ
jgi:zinc and cadmium transporter